MIEKPLSMCARIRTHPSLNHPREQDDAVDKPVRRDIDPVAQSPHTWTYIPCIYLYMRVYEETNTNIHVTYVEINT